MSLEGELSYPESVKLVSYGSAARKYPSAIGFFKAIPNIYVNGRPVWKHQENSVYLYFGGYIFDIDHNTTLFSFLKDIIITGT